MKAQIDSATDFAPNTMLRLFVLAIFASATVTVANAGTDVGNGRPAGSQISNLQGSLANVKTQDHGEAANVKNPSNPNQK